MVGLNCPRNAARKFNRNLWGANERQPFRSHDLSTSQRWWVLLGIGRMLAVPEIQPVKIRRNVWWVLTVPEMQPVNLERMYGEPVRDNHLYHMFYVYQSEMVGPFGNRTDFCCLRNTARKFRRNAWVAKQRQPFRSHVLCVYQSEMVGPIRNPANTVLLVRLLTNHKPPFLKKNMPIHG